MNQNSLLVKIIIKFVKDYFFHFLGAPTVYSDRKSAFAKSHLKSKPNKNPDPLPILEENVLEESITPFDSSIIDNLEKLGQGGFGEVYRAYDRKLKSLVVLKYLNKLNKSNEDIIDEIRYEIAILKRINKLKLPNFLKFYGIYSNEDKYVIEIESGEIDMKQILDIRKAYEIQEAAYILKTLAKDYSILEDNGVAHCDVKPDNVIIFRDGDSFIYKISDFGISILAKKGVKMISCQEYWGHTPGYVSPEVRKINKIDFEKPENLEKKYDPFLADVYSLGISILKLINIKKKDFLNKNDMNEPLFVLIRKMISKNPDDRPRFSDIIKECEKIPMKKPQNEEQNMRDYRKFMEQNKYIKYLRGTFYKYLDLNLEKEASLYLETLLAIDLNSYSHYSFTLEDVKNDLTFAQGDFAVFFKKDYDKALKLYTQVRSQTTLAIEQYPYIATSYMRRMIMFSVKYLNEKNEPFLKELEDDLLELISIDFRNHGASSVIDYGFTDDGNNNMAIFYCLLKNYEESKKCIENVKIKDIPYYNNLSITHFMSGNASLAINLSSECNKLLENEKWKIQQNDNHIKIFLQNQILFSEKLTTDFHVDRFKFIFKFEIGGWFTRENENPWTAQAMIYGKVKKRRILNKDDLKDDDDDD